MEALYEVTPTQEVKESTKQAYYLNESQRESLIAQGYVPVNPYAEEGVALKTVREIVVS